MKIVINVQYGGFGISTQAVLELRKRGCKDSIKCVLLGETWPGTEIVEEHDFGNHSANRLDPLLIALIEEKGSEWVSGVHATLKIVEIPDDMDYEVEENDGTEWVAEKHRTWR